MPLYTSENVEFNLSNSLKQGYGTLEQTGKFDWHISQKAVAPAGLSELV